MTVCRDEDYGARLIAAIDAFAKTNGSASLERKLDITAQVNYSARHAEIVPGLTLKPPQATGKLDLVRSALVGDLADITYRPNEILGDDITEKVLLAYNRYATAITQEKANFTTQTKMALEENKLDTDTILDLKDESGLLDAIEDARDLILDKFEEDPLRSQYAFNWLSRFESPQAAPGDAEKLLYAASQNFTKNALVNNIRAGMLNHVQLATTTIPEYGFSATKRGMESYRKAVKAKDPELEEFLGARFYEGEKDSKYDFFSSPEHANQGITYYTAKEKALAEGKSLSEAKAEGRKAIEKTQFKARLGNEPRLYWNGLGRTNLSLLSYAIQMRRLHHDWIRGMAKAGKEGDGKAFVQNAKAWLTFMGVNALINGASADIPEEVGFLWEHLAPESYKTFRQADKFSLMGAMDADTARLSRIPITPAGYLLKAPAVFDTMEKITERFERLMDSPNPKNVIKAAQSTAMVLPPIPIVGNKNAGALVEYFYRTTFGDWEKYSPSGKKYETDPVKEGVNLLRGRSLSENIEN